MSLTIGRMVVGGAIPRRWAGAIPIVDRVVRDALPTAWASQLPAIWGNRPPICRLKRLHIRVRIAGRQLTEGGLAQASTDAFVRTLLIALDQPHERGDLLMAESRGDWLARWLVRRLAGGAEEWAFPVLGALNDGSYDEVVAATVAQFPSDVIDMLVALAARHELDRWLGATGPRTQEMICDAADRTLGPRVTLSPGDLLIVARLVLPTLRSGRRTLATPATAIRLFVTWRTGGDGSSGPPASPNAILRLLQALDVLIAHRSPAGWPDESELPELVLALTPVVADTALAIVIARMVSQTSSTPPAAAEELSQLVSSLRQAMGQIAEPIVKPALTIELRDAGIFLMIATIEALDWPRRLRQSTFWARHGSSALTYTLFGLALTLLERPIVESDDADQSASLFAGWVGEPSLAAYRHALSEGDEAVRRALLADLDADGPDRADSETWQKTFERLADCASAAFAHRLRGFRRSSRAFVGARFFKSPGRVTIDDKTLVVHLAANPFWSAVQVSGADTPIDAVPWLGGRRVEFELEGL